MDHEIGTFCGDQSESIIEGPPKILGTRAQVILETSQVGIGEVAELYLIWQALSTEQK